VSSQAGSFIFAIGRDRDLAAVSALSMLEIFTRLGIQQSKIVLPLSV